MAAAARRNGDGGQELGGHRRKSGLQRTASEFDNVPVSAAAAAGPARAGDGPPAGRESRSPSRVGPSGPARDGPGVGTHLSQIDLEFSNIPGRRRPGVVGSLRIRV
jgi:hypothetical protein